MPEGAVNLDLIVYGELGNVLCIRESLNIEVRQFVLILSG